jgi:hypothetical protein
MEAQIIQKKWQKMARKRLVLDISIKRMED